MGWGSEKRSWWPPPAMLPGEPWRTALCQALALRASLPKMPGNVVTWNYVKPYSQLRLFCVIKAPQTVPHVCLCWHWWPALPQSPMPPAGCAAAGSTRGWPCSWGCSLWVARLVTRRKSLSPSLAEGFVLSSSGPHEGLPWCEVGVHLRARGGTRLPDSSRCWASCSLQTHWSHILN